MNRIMPYESALRLLRYLQEHNIVHEYDHEKHRLLLPGNDAEGQLYLRLPITLAPPVQGKFREDTPVNYVILLIQSGSCAVGYFENGRNYNHKVFRSYMVRKKQGKSQIKYLKTKGKSRAGSRVRLGETVEFFENINERLQEYFEEHEIDRIAISCSKTLLPYLYSSKVETPFDKHDLRLLKIPKHVHTPIYEVLLDTNRYLMSGELVYDETRQQQADELITATGISAQTYIPGEDDTWETEPDVWEPEEDEDDEMEW